MSLSCHDLLAVLQISAMLWMLDQLMYLANTYTSLNPRGGKLHTATDIASGVFTLSLSLDPFLASPQVWFSTGGVTEGIEEASSRAYAEAKIRTLEEENVGGFNVNNVTIFLSFVLSVLVLDIDIYLDHIDAVHSLLVTEMTTGHILRALFVLFNSFLLLFAIVFRNPIFIAVIEGDNDKPGSYTVGLRHTLNGLVANGYTVGVLFVMADTSPYPVGAMPSWPDLHEDIEIGFVWLGHGGEKGFVHKTQQLIYDKSTPKACSSGLTLVKYICTVWNAGQPTLSKSGDRFYYHPENHRLLGYWVLAEIVREGLQDVGKHSTAAKCTLIEKDFQLPWCVWQQLQSLNEGNVSNTEFAGSVTLGEILSIDKKVKTVQAGERRETTDNETVVVIM